ncbi:MAG TPA: hypothetical protein VMW27_02300 [Thermoanaerobaculia bacterium]|nr:hypothetical protein [Thermoanaerobaculia bacterium]
MSQPLDPGQKDQGLEQPYFPMDPYPNYTQAVGTAMTGGGFLALAGDPATGDTSGQSMMAFLAWANELFMAALAILGLDLYTFGLILVGLGTLLNIISLWMRPREHFLSKLEQVRRRNEKRAARTAVASPSRG